MSNEFRPYLFKRPQTIATEVTHRKHLAALGMIHDIDTNEVIQRFGTQYDDVNFDTLIKNQETKYYDDDRPFTWETIGRKLKRAELKEARKIDGTVISSSNVGSVGNIGTAGEHFFLVFTTKLFHFGEILIGRQRSHYQMQIVQQPISEGSDTVYEVQLVTGNDTGISPDLLLPGEWFTYEYSLAESEGSNPRGGVRSQTMSKDRSEWTTIRKDKEFTGRADRQQAFLVDIPVVIDGKKGYFKSWFDVESEEFRREWTEEKSRVRLFARSNRTASGLYLNLGESGNVEKQGDGFIAQIERGNVGEYNTFGKYFTLEPMIDMLTKAVIEGKVPLNRRKWVVVTGSYGMDQASKWIMSQTKGWEHIEVDAAQLGIINKVASKDTDVALGFGAQFTTYRAPNGITLNFMVDMQLDDPDRNMEPGPDGRGTMSSYVYYIMDLGNDGFSNFVNCRIKDTAFEDEYFYTIGARNPWGIKLPGNVRSHAKDMSAIGVMGTFGGYVRDPYRCLVYKPSGYVLG